MLPTQPLIAYAGHVNSFAHIKPTIDVDERWIFCGGDDGILRAWDIRTGRSLMSASPLHVDAGLLPCDSRRSISWRQVTYLDDFDSILTGSESGVAGMTMRR